MSRKVRLIFSLVRMFFLIQNKISGNERRWVRDNLHNGSRMEVHWKYIDTTMHHNERPNNLLYLTAVKGEETLGGTETEDVIAEDELRLLGCGLYIIKAFAPFAGEFKDRRVAIIRV